MPGDVSGSLELGVRVLRNARFCTPGGYSRDLRRLEMVKRFRDGLETDFYVRVDGGSEKDYELFPRETAAQAAREFFLAFFYGANIQASQRPF